MDERTNLKAWLVISVFVTAAITSTAGADLRALYEFEGNFDNSIFGPAGTPVGDATIVYDAVRDSNVLRLDGNGDYVRFGNDSVEAISAAITFAAWIKTSALETGDSVVTKGYAWRLHGNGGPTRFSTSGGPTNSGLNGAVNVADGTWHHVAAVYDGTKKYLYVDGSLDTSVDCTGSLDAWSGYIFAAGALLKEYTDESGFYADYPKNYYSGLVDDVRVYDHALSANEIGLLARTGTESLKAEDAVLNR